MAFRWRANDCQTLNYGLVACDYSGDPVLLRNPIFLGFFRGGSGSSPPSLWIHACQITQKKLKVGSTITTSCRKWEKEKNYRSSITYVLVLYFVICKIIFLNKICLNLSRKKHYEKLRLAMSLRGIYLIHGNAASHKCKPFLETEKSVSTW